MLLPDRLTPLADQIASGGQISRDEMRRTADLQAIDIALLGRQALAESEERERIADEQFAQLVGYPVGGAQ